MGCSSCADAEGEGSCPDVEDDGTDEVQRQVEEMELAAAVLVGGG